MWKEYTPNDLNEKLDSALYQLRRQWTDEERELAFDEDMELEAFEDECLNEIMW